MEFAKVRKTSMICSTSPSNLAPYRILPGAVYVSPITFTTSTMDTILLRERLWKSMLVLMPKISKSCPSPTTIRYVNRRHFCFFLLNAVQTLTLLALFLHCSSSSILGDATSSSGHRRASFLGLVRPLPCCWMRMISSSAGRSRKSGGVRN